jgi:transcriptional regulator with GAF, ATPase, and Fis domain
MLNQNRKFIPVTVVHRDAAMEKTLEYYVKETTESPMLQKQFQNLISTKKPMSLIRCNLSIDQMPMEEELLEQATKFGIHNYIVIPLVSHSNVVGTISFILNYPGRSYDEEIFSS